MSRVTPDILLQAYAVGLFPMAKARDDRAVFWVEPQARGVLPLDGLHLPRSLRRTIRRGTFEIRIDTAFGAVIRACREATAVREESWINDEIAELFEALHGRGHAHSVECWHDGTLAGGLYGVALGAAFFGESMFTRTRDASKVALVALVGHLRRGAFRLLDCQFTTAHLRRFGTIEIAREDYRVRLAAAARKTAVFYPDFAGFEEILQSTTQTS